MCGINGIVALSDLPASAEEGVRTRDLMSDRGPDGAGLHVEPHAVLGHRRLAIVDLTEASAQPFSTADGRLHVTFNGEIYNYRALREELQAAGVQLRTTGDTEVVLEAFRAWGERCVERFVGMFAFAVWDSHARALFVARDHHGIKPLYYHADAKYFRFASSLKALAAGAGLSRDLDDSALLTYLAWGHVCDPDTLLRGVRRLPAGSTLWVRQGHVEAPRAYWTLARVYANVPTAPPADLPVLAARSLRSAVHRHLVADVEVGLFLSAGIDSTALLGLASEVSGRALRSATLAFPAFRGSLADEGPLAAEVADMYGANHRTVNLDVEDAERALPEFLRAMDSPSNDAFNSYLVSREVRRLGLKCALAGVGGDEMFGGYPTMHRYRGLRRMAPTLGRKRLAVPAGWLAARWPRMTRPKAAFAHEALARPETTYLLVRGVFMPAEVERLVGAERYRRAGGLEAIVQPVTAAWDGLGNVDPWIQSVVAEQALYMRQQLLRDADWASMAHGLELRVPLVDRVLTETLGTQVAALRGRGRKELLAQAPTPALPREVATRPKTGFSLPMQEWTARAFEAGDMSVERGPFATGPGLRDPDLVEGVRRGSIHWSRAWTLGVAASWLGRSAA